MFINLRKSFNRASHSSVKYTILKFRECREFLYRTSRKGLFGKFHYCNDILSSWRPSETLSCQIFLSQNLLKMVSIKGFIRGSHTCLAILSKSLPCSFPSANFFEVKEINIWLTKFSRKPTSTSFVTCEVGHFMRPRGNLYEG